jgi:hypothetical protein
MKETEFWDDFVESSRRWAEMLRSRKARDAFQAVENLLDFHELSYCFDITSNDAACFLIFSPEGDPDVGHMIDRLVEVAPHVDNWLVLGRRPRKPLPDVCQIVRNLYMLDPLHCRYLLSSRDARPHIDMYVPSSTDLTPEEAKGMISTFLWHALGEGYVMGRGIDGTVHFSDNLLGPTLTAEELVASTLRL